MNKIIRKLLGCKEEEYKKIIEEKELLEEAKKQSAFKSDISYLEQQYEMQRLKEEIAKLKAELLKRANDIIGARLNIFVIRPTEKGKENQTYDCYGGFIVIAKDEQSARKLCHCADECSNASYMYDPTPEQEIKFGKRHIGICYWKDSKLTYCEKVGVTDSDEEKIIGEEFHAG